MGSLGYVVRGQRIAGHQGRAAGDSLSGGKCWVAWFASQFLTHACMCGQGEDVGRCALGVCCPAPGLAGGTLTSCIGPERARAPGCLVTPCSVVS